MTDINVNDAKNDFVTSLRIVDSKEYFNTFKTDYGTEETLVNVDEIIEDVRLNGDEAVKKYALKFNEININGKDNLNFEVSKEEIKAAYSSLNSGELDFIKKAADNISEFAKAQLTQYKDFSMTISDSEIGQKVIPINSVGCYVPGGRYPLPSSALMSVLTAKIAGVKEIIVCSPNIDPVTIVAADYAGASKIFRIGGAQAIAAMAYGTKSIPKVDKIVGPGNKYVAYAKKKLYGVVGIDFIAGPSEVLVIADDTGNPKYIAADLLAQAEHDPNARCFLLTTSIELAEMVNEEIGIQLKGLTTKEVISQSLLLGLIIVSNEIDELIDISNKIAPEHLELQVKPEIENKLLVKLNNYGSLFIGEYSAEVFGDYCSGTNHVLPTGGASRYSAGLGVKDFLKLVTYQRISKKGAEKLIPIAENLAKMEGLDAHRNAAFVRRN